MLKFQLSLISLSRSEEVELREVVQEVTEYRKRLAQIVDKPSMMVRLQVKDSGTGMIKRNSRTCLSVFIGEIASGRKVSLNRIALAAHRL
ncbi:hypothetical protein [Brevibacillus brevis]|uniref:hypothetical protein n=1 Tax=Brevibacillus brevis TaxID=1393 RepID=UPI0025A4D17D|nr:hypothetical protein [Brevibacillus brevis]WJQ84203.1 hypothetical protein QN310_14095 [Brevibacillus brevis]